MNLLNINQYEDLYKLLDNLNIHNYGLYNHSINVANISQMFANDFNLNNLTLYHCGLFHDLGKLKIPNSIINKNGKLSEIEFEIVKKHPIYSYELITMNHDFDDIANVSQYHHEKFNGKGYPYSLKYEEIPLYARIVSVVDCLDAIYSKRIYKPSLKLDETFDLLIKEKEISFDPYIIDLLIKKYNDIKEYYDVVMLDTMTYNCWNNT